MPLTQEQVKELKAQLSQQIQHLPEEQRTTAQKQIDEMPSEAIESMLKQQQQQDIFRQVISGKIPSKKIDENQDYLAVLDTKPISEGHTVLIPKKPIKKPEELPKSSFELAEKITKKIKEKLKAKSAEVIPESKFGEVVINIIPIYKEPLNLDSQRQEASQDSLQITLDKLNKEKPKPIKIKTKPSGKLIKLPRRIP